MLSRKRFFFLGCYIEAPIVEGNENVSLVARRLHKSPYTLILEDETYQSLRLAEDLRLFHCHMASGGKVKLLRTETPLVVYRHREGMSQSSQTSKSLLLKLRVKALEDRILKVHPKFLDGFCIWGAGRDGKAFLKALDKSVRSKVRCMADIDEKKIRAGYMNKSLGLKIPVIHFSKLSVCCKKLKNELNERVKKKARKDIEEYDLNFQQLPVIVCVAMYRTNGMLEENVKSIGRTEGEDLWHFI